MAIRLLNRPSINIKPAESGLDKFFEQLSKYSDPEYQLRKRESDARLKFAEQQAQRDTARLNLNRRKFLEDLEQNNLARTERRKAFNLQEDKFELDKKKLEQDTFQDNWTMAKTEVDDLIANTYSDSKSLANMNVESILAGYDKKVQVRLKPHLDRLKASGEKQEASAQSFMDRYNNKNPDNVMDMYDARRLVGDEQAFRSFLYDSYVKDKDDINPSDARRLTYFTNRLSALETKRNKLAEEIALLGSDDPDYQRGIDKIGEYDSSIANFELQAAKIVGKGTSGDLINDPFNTTGQETGQETGDYINPFLVSYDDQVPVPFRPVDEDYDIAFGTDDEAEQIVVDTAVDTAQNNATGANAEDVIVGEDIPEDVPDAWTEPATEDMEGNIVSGLNLAVAGPQLPPNFIDPSIPEKDLRPRYKEAPEEEGIAGDLPIENIEFDDLSGLAKAPAPTVDNLKSLNIVDDKGEALNVANPAKFQSQLKSMYDKVFRKGARSRLSKEEYTRLNKELIRMISTGSGIEPDVTNRMTKIIPREIEMFLKSKKRDKDSIVRALQENIRWAN